MVSGWVWGDRLVFAHSYEVVAALYVLRVLGAIPC